MNLKKTLKNMDKSDLRFICRELGIKLSRRYYGKKILIDKLLKPLS